MPYLGIFIEVFSYNAKCIFFQSRTNTQIGQLTLFSFFWKM